MAPATIASRKGGNVKKLRILVVDDHALVRRGAREVLNSQQGWRVVGEAANGVEAVEKAAALKPDVAIVDVSIPNLDGIEVTRRIRKANPDIKVLVLTMDESDQMVRRALEAGARGYVLKSDLTDCLPRAVKAIAEGRRFLTPKVSEIVLDVFLNTKDRHQQARREGVPLGPREIEILRLLGEGRTNKEIAAKLQIAVRTVETHRSNIMHKLGLHSVVELVRYGLRHGIATA
jgi:DNA-binding NarL/FixJ family response regulator